MPSGNTNAAAQQCSAAVQQRLYNRQSIGSILGAVLGANTSGRVLSITQVNPRTERHDPHPRSREQRPHGL